MKNFHKRGEGGLLVFILLVRNTLYPLKWAKKSEKGFHKYRTGGGGGHHVVKVFHKILLFYTVTITYNLSKIQQICHQIW